MVSLSSKLEGDWVLFVILHELALTCRLTHYKQFPQADTNKTRKKNQ